MAAEPATVQVAPPLDQRAFQILGADSDRAALAGVPLDPGIRKRCVRVELPREESHQSSDLEQLGRAAGVAPEAVPLEVGARSPPGSATRGVR